MRDEIRDTLLVRQRRERAQHPAVFEPMASLSQDMCSTAVLQPLPVPYNNLNNNSKASCALKSLVRPGWLLMAAGPSKVSLILIVLATPKLGYFREGGRFECHPLYKQHYLLSSITALEISIVRKFRQCGSAKIQTQDGWVRQRERYLCAMPSPTPKLVLASSSFCLDTRTDGFDSHPSFYFHQLQNLS